jgi:hypothetical protein
MSSNHTQRGNMVQRLIDEAKRIYEDSFFCYAGHSEEARWWGQITLRLGIPATIIAAIAGVTSLSGQSSSALVLGLDMSVVVGALAFVVAAMSGLSTFLDPKGQVSKHYQACIAYLRLSSDVRMFYEIDCAKGANVNELEEKLKKLSARLKDLNDQTPMISERARRVAKKSVDSGRYIYQVDKEKRK